MFVTSFYEIYGKSERILQYMEWFTELGQSGLPIIVFTDPSLVKLFSAFPESVRVIPLALDTCELYQMGMNYQGELPLYRTVEKDTKEYLSLMNTKAEFVKKAAELCDDSLLIWIDFGICKMLTDKIECFTILKQIAHMTFHKIVFPGCWEFEKSVINSHHIHWRFCGSFFIMPRQHITYFYDNCKNVLHDFCTLSQYCLSWEINIWSVIEFCTNKQHIIWYQADHNDTIIKNINTILLDACSTTM